MAATSIAAKAEDDPQNASFLKKTDIVIEAAGPLR
jgi:hypothetical protein